MTEPEPGAKPGAGLRLYLTAALALAYVVLWWAFGLRGKTAPAGAQEVGSTPRQVWYQDLPSGQRPAVAVPPGWRIVPPAVAPARASEPRPFTAGRAFRVRTRSS